MPDENTENMHYPALADAVAAIAGDRASLGQIRQRTDLTKTTISQLLKGRRVTPATLERFARGYSVPLNPLRVAMGLPALEIDPLASDSVDANEKLEVRLHDGRVIAILGAKFRKDQADVISRLIRVFLDS